MSSVLSNVSEHLAEAAGSTRPVVMRAGAGMRLAIALVVVAGGTAHAQLAMRDCGLVGERVRCGALQVLENPRAPDGRHLRLNLFVVPPKGPGPSAEPLFVLKGGPGQAATADIEELFEMFRAVRAERELVLLDQRGTGASNRLDCEVADGHFLVPKRPKECLARLTAHADLRMYTTERFVEDLESARSALGYERISLFGGSYGTRAAFEYARRYPDRVRSLILVAPAPASMRLLENFEEDGRLALAALVSDCALDPECSKVFPNLGADVQTVTKRLDDPFHVLGIQFLQYASSTARYLPLLISEAAHGRRDPLDRAIATVRRGFLDQLSIGLHLAVACSEELKGDAPATGPRTALRTEYEMACRDWPRAEVPAESQTAPRVMAPALIVVGERDPVTSVRWARAMAEQFRESHVEVVPGEGHILAGSILKCLDTLAADFLARRKMNRSCVAQHTRPSYALRIP
jgi:pimeloyl-ACP methyl ester carboxylesterase